MVPAKLTAIHRTVPGESLRDVAAKFRLSSWRAIALAPGNEQVRACDANTALPSATPLRIPPKARDLLQERVYLLHKVRASLERHFDAQKAIFGSDIVAHGLPDDLGSADVVGGVLDNLRVCVDGAVAETRLACGPFAFINSGLVITHLHDHADLRSHGGGHPSIAGLRWLLEPVLVESWSGMWGVELWVEKWRDCGRTKAVERASIYQNVIRSKVLQQTDLRLREALVAIDRLDREGAAGTAVIPP